MWTNVTVIMCQPTFGTTAVKESKPEQLTDLITWKNTRRKNLKELKEKSYLEEYSFSFSCTFFIFSFLPFSGLFLSIFVLFPLVASVFLFILFFFLLGVGWEKLKSAYAFFELKQIRPASNRCLLFYRCFFSSYFILLEFNSINNIQTDA